MMKKLVPKFSKMTAWLRISFLLLVPCLSLISALNSTSIEAKCEFFNRNILWCQNGIPNFSLYNQTLLDGVSTLWITHCDSIQIENYTFPSFKILKDVKILCEKTEIANGSFDNLRIVRLLKIEKNVIAFPRNIFCNCNKLQHLWLERNELSADDDVGLLTNCYTLSQADRCGQTINWLSLANNNLTFIKNDGFLCNLRALTRLDLSNNSISGIDKEVFNSVPELLALKLAGNFLSNLTEDIFTSLHMLIELDLSYNQISSVPEGLFNSLPNLSTLKLEGNSLTQLNYKIFENVSDLFRLDISNNELFNISKSFANLTQLKALKLSVNRLENIDSSTFLNLTYLNKLNLDKNSISEISENAFTGCPRMHELDLSYNKLREVPNLISCQEMSLLHLHHNKIINISTPGYNNSSSISDVQNLKLLDLSYNSIEFIDESIIRDLSQKISFASINILDLSHNQITDFEYPTKVVQLNLAHNQIEQLPQYRLENTSLIIYLNVSHNLIENISSDQFPHSLTHLFLDSNKINYVESLIFKNLTNLKVLSIRNNLLTTLYNFTLLRTLTSIDIRDNPWSCDCHLVHPVFDFIQTYKRQIKTVTDLFCQTSNRTELPIRIVNFNITQCVVT